MKYIYFLSLIALSTFAIAQNWSPILTNEKMNFQHSDSSFISHTIWVDDFDVTGSDTTLFLNKVVTDHPTDIDKALRNQPQFLFTTMNNLNNGTYHFSEPGYYILKTWSSMGDYWLFDPDNNITATVIGLMQEEIFGTMDSIKIISLSDGHEIKLSKHFGIILFPDFANNGFYELVGIQDSEYGLSVPVFWDIYNFEVGDIFQYNTSILNPGGSGSTTRKITITSKVATDSSLNYTLDGIYYAYPGVGGGSTYTASPIYTYSSNHPTNLFPGEIYLLPNSETIHGTGKVFTSSKIFLDMETGTVFKEFGTQYETNEPNLYYELEENSDSLFRLPYAFLIGDPCGLMGFGFGSNIGDLFKSEGCFEYWDDKSLVGYIKDGDTVGNITPDSLLLVDISDKEFLENEINIYPNPASDFLHIILPHHKNARLEIRNIHGELIFQKEFSKQEEIINTTNLIPGVYFFLILQKNEILQTGKILIKR